MRIGPEPLEQLVTRIFEAAGCPPGEAACVARHLVSANLCGHDSHGVIRVAQYVSGLKEGTIHVGQQITTTFESETVAVIDGHMGFGQSIGEQAMALLAKKARRSGLGLIALGNTYHVGRGGDWAEQLAEEGLISIHFVSTTGRGLFAVPFGGTDRRLSLCVIAACVPVEGRPPILLDCATTVTAEGKLRVAKNKGIAVPPGQIVDKQGNPTIDPNDFYDGGAVLTMGGHKGFGLNVIADLLAGVLSGMGCTKPGVDTMVNTMTSIAIDPGPMTDREAYVAEVKRFSDWVRGSPPRDPGSEVQMPGDFEHRTRAERRRGGIPTDDETWRQIVETGVLLGLPRGDFDEVSSGRVG